MRPHVSLQAPLFCTHQLMIESTEYCSPADLLCISQIVDFQCGPDLIEELQASRRAKRGPNFKQARQRGVDPRGSREEPGVIA
jgi:hypothetical protein